MIKEIKLVYISDKNKDHNTMHNTISSIKSETENSQINFIGKKRKNSNDHKELSIFKQTTLCFNRTNIKCISNCPICLQKINLRDKNTCFLGHIFHSACINKRKSSRKNKCSFCSQKIL